MDGPVRILHVDDEPGFVDLVGDALERTDDRFSVIPETDPKSALETLEAEPVDCVVSDFQMPGMNGIDLLEAVRADRPDLPFILFTGKGSEAVASDAIAAGVTDYLQKSGGMEQYELLANRIEIAVSRRRSEARAAKLERIRRVLRDVNQELVRAREREELEHGVCEILAGADPFTFAWIGERRGVDDKVVPRTHAGEGGNYLEEIEVNVDDPDLGLGPTGRALRTGELVVSQRIAEDPDLAPWHDAALERGFESSAAIPIVFEDTEYGVLSVYSGEPEAFEPAEEALLRELGSDVAHALHRIEQEERYRRLVTESVNGIGVHEIVTDESGDPVDYVFLEVNDAFEELTGLSATEIEGRRVSEVLPELDDSYVERFGHVALDEEGTRFTAYSEPLDRHYDISAYPLGGGRFVVTFQDVTAALEHERELEDIIDQMDDAIFVHELDGTFRTVNQAAVERYGYSVETLRNMRPVDLVAEDATVEGAETPADRIEEIMEQGSLVFETVHRTEDGEQLPVEINATRFTHKGEPAILAIARDISARKARARELEESERRYRSLFESNPAVIWEEDYSEMKQYLDELAAEVEDMEAHVRANQDVVEEMFERIEVIDVSQQAVERYGADSKAHLMENFPRLFTETAYEANMEIALRIQRGETHFRVETAARSFDGERLEELIDVNVPEAYADDFSRVYLTVTDITERKEREAELRAVKERLDLALEAGQLGVWDWDVRSDEVKRDERWAAILGHEPGEVSHDLRAWEEKVHPDDLPATERALSEHVNAESTYYESEHRLKTADGDWKWVREMGRITEYDDDGEPMRAVGVTQDIDEQKRAMTLLERQKEQLDEFATMVSHDLRNPLNVAQGRLDLAREEFESDHLAAVDNSLDRIDAIIDEVLTLTATGAEVQTDMLETIRLDEIASETWENVDTTDGTLTVTGDRAFEGNERRLQHVFENLYRNAIQHTDGGVAVEVGPLEEGFYVADDGPGIPVEDSERVFESGYSTSQDGTGFGLAIVKKMVEAHGWEIEAVAAASGGARFEVTGIETMTDPDPPASQT